MWLAATVIDARLNEARSLGAVLIALTNDSPLSAEWKRLMEHGVNTAIIQVVNDVELNDLRYAAARPWQTSEATLRLAESGKLEVELFGLFEGSGSIRVAGEKVNYLYGRVEEVGWENADSGWVPGQTWASDLDLLGAITFPAENARSER